MVKTVTMTDCTLQFIWVWSGHTVASRPKSVLLVVALVSTGCFVCSICFAPLPSFADPSLGFETRGTELGRRLIAFEKMLDSVGSPSAATAHRPLLSKVAAERARTRRHSKPGRPLRFCVQPSSEYSQVVVSGGNLWSLEEVRVQCLLESRLTKPEEYHRLCEQRSPGTCCPPWSLPNTIAFLHNRTSCRHITEDDVRETRKLVEECRQYFMPEGSDSPPVYPTGRQVPPSCRRKRAIFNLIYYILDSNYKSAADRLKKVLVVLPVAQSSAALPYYHSLHLPSLRIHNLSISALTLGVKEAVFSELLVRESWLLVGGMVLVSLCLFLYTSSLLLTAATLLSVLFSLSLAYFFYTLVFRVTFFPFINLLSSVVAIGVGSDTSLILYKLWSTEAVCMHGMSRVPEELRATEYGPGGDARSHLCHQEEAVVKLYRVSSLGLVLTSLTTAAAFFATYISNITSLACFGVFSGSVVLCNLLVTWWWMPACLVLWGGDGVSARQRGRGKWGLVLKARPLWLVIFPVVTLCSCLLIYLRGGLPLPDTADFPLLLPTHPLETFHFYSQSFHLYRHHTREATVVMRWVWGVEAEDSGDTLDPASRGSLHLDNTFDPTLPSAQLFLTQFCRDLRREEWYGGGAGVVGGRCFPESLADWMRRRCVVESDRPCCEASAPQTPSVYTVCAGRAADSIHRSLLSHPVAGPYYLHPDTTLPPGQQPFRTLVVEFDSNRSFTASYSDMHSFYTEVEEWTVKQLAEAPSSVSNGWFLSNLGLYDLQHSLRRDTAASVTAASLLVLLLIAVATRDLRLALSATVTVAGSTVCTAALLVLLGWKLDVLESSTASLAVGLSVDFTIHYALHYRLSGEPKRTVESVAGPLLTCMLTSCLAGAAMMPSQTLPYRRVAVFLLVLMPVSYLYSTLFFLSLLPHRPTLTSQSTDIVLTS